MLVYLAESMEVHRPAVQNPHACERAWPEVGPFVACLTLAFYDALDFCTERHLGFISDRLIGRNRVGSRQHPSASQYTTGTGPTMARNIFVLGSKLTFARVEEFHQKSFSAIIVVIVLPMPASSHLPSRWQTELLANRNNGSLSQDGALSL